MSAELNRTTLGDSVSGEAHEVIAKRNAADNAVTAGRPPIFQLFMV